MQDSNPLISRVAQEIARSSKTSPTAAGQAKSDRSEDRTAHIDAINQVFTLFRINYHNQYHKAFGDDSVLNQAKKLWLDSLMRFRPGNILRGAKHAIETCEYLPTLHKMICCCEGAPTAHGLPDAYTAYVEACQAPSPKSEYHWSHYAVYHAGRESDWFFLANNPQKQAFPVFEKNYLRLCEAVIGGTELPEPNRKELPPSIESPLSKAENLERLQQLRQDLGL